MKTVKTRGENPYSLTNDEGGEARWIPMMPSSKNPQNESML